MSLERLFSLKDQVILVTGGAGMYGMPICEALAEAGARVIIASRNREHCLAAAASLTERGLQAGAESFDQSDEGSIRSLCDRVCAAHKHIDVLVNNCVARPMRRYEDPLENFRASMETNATGLFSICREFLEPMMKRGTGAIINVGSVQSSVAPRFRNYEGTAMTTPPDYHFHKHGLVGLTRYLAAYAGPRGVRVNAISPGGFETADMPESFRRNYCSQVPLGRLARHDDIKGAVVFLASSASAYITGQNLIVDGGYSA